MAGRVRVAAVVVGLVLLAGVVACGDDQVESASPGDQPSTAARWAARPTTEPAREARTTGRGPVDHRPDRRRLEGPADPAVRLVGAHRLARRPGEQRRRRCRLRQGRRGAGLLRGPRGRGRKGRHARRQRDGAVRHRHPARRTAPAAGRSAPSTTSSRAPRSRCGSTAPWPRATRSRPPRAASSSRRSPRRAARRGGGCGGGVGRQWPPHHRRR